MRFRNEPFGVLLLALPLLAQSPVRQWRADHEHQILDEYASLLKLPNVARNLDDMRANAARIQAKYKQRGVELQTLEVPNAPPALFGELKAPGANSTIVLYAHYDGQPVVPAQWNNQAPFTPEIHDAAGRALAWPSSGPIDPEWRLQARSAGDDKAPIMAFLAALDALRAAGRAPSINLKFFFDGEEEAGSPHLKAILTKYKPLLASDGWIFCDGPIHQSRRQHLAFGARGNTTVEITIYGPKSELHSGHYGNWAPNPALELAQLLTSMKDADGRVRIAGFYDDVTPLNDAEKRAVAALPDVDQQLREQFGLGSIEVPGRRVDESVLLRALNVQGFSSGGVGPEARNAIPSTATASIGLRLVKGMDPAKTAEQFAEHVRRQGYFVTDQPPTDAVRLAHARVAMIVNKGDGTRAVRTPLDAPFSRRVIQAVEGARGPLLLLPSMGGTLPIDSIEDVLAAPIVVVPIANHDNNQHTHNENIRLQNLWDGIETMAALMTMR